MKDLTTITNTQIKRITWANVLVYVSTRLRWWYTRANISQTLTEIWIKSSSFNSLWPNGAIWRHTPGSTLTPVITCFLKAQNHCLAQVGFSTVWSYGIHLRELSQEIIDICILDMSLKITNLNLEPHLLKASESICTCTSVAS